MFIKYIVMGGDQLSSDVYTRQHLMDSEGVPFKDSSGTPLSVSEILREANAAPKLRGEILELKRTIQQLQSQFNVVCEALDLNENSDITQILVAIDSIKEQE